MTAALPAQFPLDLPHRASLARDDIIVSDANRLAVAAIDSWPHWRHPVLLVVGPAGSGKSHLAAAWAEMADAVRFPADFRALGTPFAVVVDDIDAGRLPESALFDLVNAARLGEGFVLATARMPAAAMAFGLPDLRSRLGAATMVATGTPDDALLEGVLAKLFADRHIAIDPRLLAFLVLRMERSLEAASRLVAEIDREALASKDKLSRSLVQRVLDRSGARPRDENHGAAGRGAAGHDTVATVWDRPMGED